MITAIVRPPSAAIARCELTYLEREPIDVQRALAQHAAYVQCLRDLGVRLIELPAEPALPDATFVEDTAVVVDEVAFLTLPGAPSRRGEVESVAAALAPYRALRRMALPATLDGGDVLRIERTFYVGLGGRSNEEGVAQLRDALAPFGYDVRGVPVTGCLHLKTACTYLEHGLLLANPAWIDPSLLGGVEVLAVPPDEPYAANALTIGGATLLPSAFPRTRSLLECRGLSVVPVEVSELQKAEAGVTCQSILFNA
jgi:dimethylargininase